MSNIISILDPSFSQVVLVLQDLINNSPNNSDNSHNNIGTANNISNFGINNFAISNLGFNYNNNRENYHNNNNNNDVGDHIRDDEHENRNDEDLNQDEEEYNYEEELQQSQLNYNDNSNDNSNNYIYYSQIPINRRFMFTSNFLNYFNNYSNTLVNNFIDSTLNESKPVYKKIASDNAISHIQELQFSSLAHNEQNICPIYCTPFSENETICKLPCNHIFSKDGIYKWLKESNLCPICRYELDYIEVKNDNLNLEQTNFTNNENDTSETNNVSFVQNNLDLSNQYNNNYPSFNLINILMRQEQLEYQQEQFEYQRAILRSLSEN